MNKRNYPVVFVVEDDPAFNKLIVSHLKINGIKDVKGFITGEECMENFNPVPDIIIQDYDLPGINGVNMLKKIKNISNNTEFIFLSGQPSIEIAVDAMKNGAFDYIVKDTVAHEKVLYKIKKLIEIYNLQKETTFYKKSIIVFMILLLFTWIGFILFEFIRQ